MVERMNNKQKILDRKIKIQEKKLAKQGKKRESESIKKILSLTAFLQLKKDKETLQFMSLNLMRIKKLPSSVRLIEMESLINSVENIVKQKYGKKKQ